MRTLEEKKNLLREYATIGRDIDTVQEQIARLRSNSEKITAGFEEKSGKGSNAFGNKIEIYAERLEELEKKYEKMLEQKVKLCEDVDEALMKLSQTERYILIERYIVGTKAFIVARVLGYEQSRFFDLERMALENFDI